ncbi:MAG: SpoIIE family protein phosphatase [Thermaerobacter sp.]|nr:SpoIIE family protein phosphatase [Thermaerobacter sp.]
MAQRRGIARRFAVRWPEAAATLALAVLLAHAEVSPWGLPLPLALSVAGGAAELPFGAFGALGSVVGAAWAGDPLLGLLCLAAPLGGAFGRLRLGLRRGIAGVLWVGLLAVPAAYLMHGGSIRYTLIPLTMLLALIAASAGAALRGPSPEGRRLAAAVLAVWAALALGGVSILGTVLAPLASLLLAFAAVRVRTAAVPFAAMLGLSLVLTGNAAPAFGLGLATGAALGVYLRRYGGFQAWLGFAVGVLLPLGGMQIGALESIITTLLVLLGVSLSLPDRLYRALRSYFAPAAPVQAEPPGPPERLAEALAQIDTLVQELSQDRAPAITEETDVARFLGGVRERVCTGCPHEATCWDAGFYTTYTGVRDLMLRGDGPPAGARDLPPDLRKRCPRPDQVATAVVLAGDQLRAEANVRRLLHAERTLTRDTLMGVRQMLGWALTEPSEPEPRRLSFSSGLARVAKNQAGVSGDNYVVRELPDGRLLLGLSDGMGAGVEAAEQSASALDVVEGFLAAGMDPVVALRAANAARRGARGETFATLDLAIADLAGGEVVSLKIGAPETYLRRNGEVQVLRGDALPLGILPEAQAAVQHLPLRAGDLLVLVSDGVLEGPPGPRGHWLEALLEALTGSDPQYLAEAILDAALGHRRHARDDVTVLVTAFHPAAQEPEIRAWVRRGHPELGIVGGRPGQTAQGRRRRPRG